MSRRRFRWTFTTLATGLTLLAFAGRAVAAPPTTAYLLEPARVFDASSEATHAGWAVLVRGDRIAAVGSTATIERPAGTQVIELPGTTLMPGLIDAHSHIFLHPYNETLWNDQVLKEPSLPHHRGGPARAGHADGGIHRVARPRHGRRRLC